MRSCKSGQESWGIQGEWIKLIATSINYRTQHTHNAMVNRILFQEQELGGGPESAGKQVWCVGQPLALPELLVGIALVFQCELWTWFLNNEQSNSIRHHFEKHNK